MPNGPGERYVAGPDAQRMDEALRLMERNRDDRAVRRAIRSVDPVARDAISGEPTEHHTYRLDCGHLIVVWLTPLPAETTFTYCEHCTRERRVVELLDE